MKEKFYSQKLVSPSESLQLRQAKIHQQMFERLTSIKIQQNTRLDNQKTRLDSTRIISLQRLFFRLFVNHMLGHIRRIRNCKNCGQSKNTKHLKIYP
jgi:hypothetical protein